LTDGSGNYAYAGTFKDEIMGFGKASICLGFWLVAAMTVWPPSSVRGQTGAESSVGYIDSAIPRTQLRLRVDAAYNDNRPDRVEFFYAKYSFLGGPGPPLAEKRVDYQEIDPGVEYAFSDRFSIFADFPTLLTNPLSNANSTGFADMDAGFKYALVACDDRFLTFQLRTYIPTGDSRLGLGTNHTTLEPALLTYQRLTDRLALEAEFRDWIPLGGTDLAGNVIRYGLGVSYDVYQGDRLRVAPVTEVVGWTILSGKESIKTLILDASGETIVNAKVGVRIDFGRYFDMYAGYGRALTGDVWYKDIMRFEFRLHF
jgi:hypothetical protein